MGGAGCWCMACAWVFGVGLPGLVMLNLGLGAVVVVGEVFKITKYKHLIPTYCFFFAIRLCSERQNTSLNHKT